MNALKKESRVAYAGIDEAGRGPLAGPIAVGILYARERNLVLPFFKKVRDSKQLSRQKREIIYEELKKEARAGRVSFAVSFVGPQVIDSVGINTATRIAIERCLKKVGCGIGTHVLLDGGLRAPREFLYQETIIRGDEKEALIALASIVAKVRRDIKMEHIAMRYPEYLFEEHKGYGTKIHVKLLRKWKPCAIHRKTYLKNLKLAV